MKNLKEAPAFGASLREEERQYDVSDGEGGGLGSCTV